MSVYRILIDLLRLHGESVSIRRALESIGTAIAESDRAIQSAQSSTDPDYIDAVVEEECDVIEALLGAAFVTTQAQITSIISGVKWLHWHYNHATGKTLATSPATKADILALAGPRVPPAQYTQVQVIDAFANYFKHRDEWTLPWATLTGRSAVTAAMITSVGAEENCTGNMRHAAQILGNSHFTDVVVLHSHVASWAGSLTAQYTAELTGLGLI
jgi:hypothetical protein